MGLQISKPHTVTLGQLQEEGCSMQTPRLDGFSATSPSCSCLVHPVMCSPVDNPKNNNSFGSGSGSCDELYLDTQEVPEQRICTCEVVGCPSTTRQNPLPLIIIDDLDESTVSVASCESWHTPKSDTSDVQITHVDYAEDKLQRRPDLLQQPDRDCTFDSDRSYPVINIMPVGD